MLLFYLHWADSQGGKSSVSLIFRYNAACVSAGSDGEARHCVTKRRVIVNS